MRVRRFPLLLASLTLACAAEACGETGDGDTPDAGVDVVLQQDAASVDVPDVVTWDVPLQDAGQADTLDVGPGRAWKHRSIGGISMGAMAINIALANPELFDTVGALGGYSDFPYMVTAGLRLHLGGFCPLETLEANLDKLNDPDADPPVFCGPVAGKEELEIGQDYNHLHFDTNGATFDRWFYLKVFQSLTMACGNFTAEPDGASPYLPPGVPQDWVTGNSRNERCASPIVLPPELSYNLEYNPEALYPVITFCDGDERTTPGLGGADFDPAGPYDRPVDVGLAVDLNGNGQRDYGEPWFLNARERFVDTGSDGCFDAREDGLGGCLSEGEPDATEPDPNGDGFHWWGNPNGTEDNERWDEGEEFSDNGLDGVASTGDYGEDNGVFDENSAFQRARSFDARALMANIDDEHLANMDFYLDAGIRDALHAAVSTRHVVGQLQARTGNVTRYDGLVARPGTLFPEHQPETFFQAAFTSDLSAETVGRHIYLEYGDPDASPEEIAEGDGGHVGTELQAINRLLIFLSLAIQRFPDPNTIPGAEQNNPMAEFRNFYSYGLMARRSYTVVLPPGYYTEEYQDTYYPVLHFLHGLGQKASDLAPAAIATSHFMQEGELNKAIVVFPDGACCRVHEPTGQRYCACEWAPDDHLACVDPHCTGPEESCEVFNIPKWELTEECNGGSLYLDLVANRWGEPRDDLGYATSVIELVNEIDAQYRTRSSQLER